jgi:Prokaryotic N-terminal methylation motif
MKKKIYALTLVEVMVALVLLSILMATLFDYFKQSSLINIKAHKAKGEIVCREKFQGRLNAIFSRITPIDDKSPCFYTQSIEGAPGSALIFSFDNGLDRDPNFCGAVKGALYLNRDKNIALSLFGKNGDVKHQILWSDVRHFNVECFDKKKMKWTKQWSKKAESPPIMIKLSIDEMQSKTPIAFGFTLPLEECEIPYSLTKRAL